MPIQHAVLALLADGPGHGYELKAELETWLNSPFVRRGGYRDDFFLKLFAASRLGSDRVDQVLRVQREAYLGELASLSRLRQGHREEPLVDLLIEAAILHTEANLRVVELAEAKAKDGSWRPQTAAKPEPKLER